MNKLIHLAGVSLIVLPTQGALGEVVMPVSPGGWERVLAIGDPCPTFSWSRDATAVDYQLAVFLEGPGEAELSAEPEAIEPLRYAERLAQSEPAMRQQISGAALSWTPAAGNCLAPGLYGWYARGLDESGLGEWSQARYFRVDGRVAAALIALALGAIRDSGLLDEAGEGAPSWVFHPGTFDGIEGSGGALVPDAFGLPSAGLAQSGIIAQAAVEGDAQGNTYFGTGAGASLDGTGLDNSFFGYHAGQNTTGGDHNTFSGFASGFYNTTGSYNTFSGHRSGYSNTEGSSNTFSGYASGLNNTTGNGNTFVGYNSGRSNATGSYNTFLGRYSGYYNATGNSNVFLGYGAGFDEPGSNKLYIENSDSADPLIYGDFAADFVIINGDLTAAGNLTVNGTFRVASSAPPVPDYVFEPGYPLRPLEEVKNFIDANGHLPDVPGAGEVARQGLDIAGMQMRLLRKVEELTLYAMQQQDRIDSQHEIIEQQRKAQEQQNKIIAQQRESYVELQDALEQQRKAFEERLAALEMAVH